MNKQEILNEYKNQEEKTLLSFIIDKINFVVNRNKIEYTNFLSLYQINLVETFLKKINFENYILWGGYENAERKVLILYPEKLNGTMVEKNYNKIMGIIRIRLCETDFGKYMHRNYLGGIVKLGIKREKIGDILVEKEGADIIILNEVMDFLIQEISMLKRFEKAEISKEKLEDINFSEVKIEETKIIVSSLRLDNFVSNLAKTSRNKALDILKSERVFINGKLETKSSKSIKEGDTITIRGKGRFVVKSFDGTTRSGRNIVSVSKFL